MTYNNRRAVFGIIISCWLAYTFSMCLKMVYSASMVAIKDEYVISHSVASLPITLYYVFYAGIQLFLAALIRKINMKVYMFITFVFSGLSFISIFFFSPVWYVCSIMAVNGITLGAVWCGSVMIFSKFLSKSKMNASLIFMGAGSSVGNTIAYGISALSMHLGNWRISFMTVGAVFLLSSLYMMFSFIRAEKIGLVPDEDGSERSAAKKVYTAEKIEAKPLVIMAAIVVFFSCILYYAFTNWMPTILKSVFSVSNSQATLITTGFPVAVFAGVLLSNYLSNKLKNDFLLNTIFGVVISGLSLALCFLYNVNIIVCITLIVGLGICLRLINNLNCSLVTLHVRDYFNSGSIASIINSSACVAAAISPAVIAAILDLSGGNWQNGFAVLFIAAVTLTAVSSLFMIANFLRKRRNAG